MHLDREEQKCIEDLNCNCVQGFCVCFMCICIFPQAATVNENADSSRHALRLLSGSALRLLSGSVYSGVETLGKELFLYFGPKALR